ncbi:hypothetical protein ACTXT7_009111 [Hymenolepis weldensis]
MHLSLLSILMEKGDFHPVPLRKRITHGITELHPLALIYLGEEFIEMHFKPVKAHLVHVIRTFYVQASNYS